MNQTKEWEAIKEEANRLSREIVGAAIEVHRWMGPGLLESVYEECLCRELELRNIPFQRQAPFVLEYKGHQLNTGYRLDLVVGGLVIVELKTIEHFEPIHEAQLLTYLRLRNLWLGLLINFNVPVLKDGLKRMVNG